MRVVVGKHYLTGQPVEVHVDRHRISLIRPLPWGDATSLPWLAPGLFDLQVNGADGIWFSDENLIVDQVLHVLEVFQRHGVARLFPTLITNSAAALDHGFRVIRAACEQHHWANHMVAGCHLEGPYISPDDGPRGAHPRAHVRPADWREFQALQVASGGRIKLLTLAPEVPGAIELIQQATSTGVVCAIGHTAATSQDIAAAVVAGASLSTHFGNGCHGLLPRHPNYLWDQLAEPLLAASLITDGHHIPPSVAKAVLWAKGIDNVIITCDASGLAGCVPGVYPAAGTQCEVLADGRIVVAGQRQYLAGSGAFTEECVSGMIQMTGISFGSAWRMAHANPARLCRVNVPQLEVGALAEFVAVQVAAEGKFQVVESSLCGSRSDGPKFGEPGQH